MPSQKPLGAFALRGRLNGLREDGGAGAGVLGRVRSAAAAHEPTR